MSSPFGHADPAGLRPGILCVDDEPHVLDALRATLRRHFEVSVATSGPAALGMLRETPGAYAIVFSDMRMPVMSGVEFLRQARLIAPDTVRILLTGQADLDTVIKVVNAAGLFRVLTKPCDTAELLQACAGALHHQRMRTAERIVLEQTLRGTVETLAEVLVLSNPAAFGRAQRIAALARALAGELALANAREVEVAALLADIGAVTLPHDTAERVYAGLPLSEHETDMVQRVPALTRGLLGRIPRLERVLELLDRSRHLGEETDPDPAADLAAQVLGFASDYETLETHGASRVVALDTLRSRGIYDVRVLAAAPRAIHVTASELPAQELRLAELAPGMTLADDVRTADGRLLVARGQRVSDELLSRLANLDAEHIRQPILVFQVPTTS